MAKSERHGKRAKHVLLNDQKLRSLRKNPDGKLYYDKVLPDLIMRNGMTATWGMKKRRPGRKHPTWIPLGMVYVPVKDPVDQQAEQDKEPIQQGALTVGEVRQKCRQWLDMLDRKIDPSTEARRVRTENQRRFTYDQLVDEHIKRHWKANKLAKAPEAERLLKREFTAWKNLPADTITPEDVDEAIRVIVDRGAKYQAHNAFGYLRGLYTWAMDNKRYRIKTSPCEGMRPVKMIGAKESRSRWLSDQELREVWSAAGELGLAGQVIRLLSLTPQRVNEIAGMPWSEVDLDKGEIIIRKDRKGVKNKIDLLVSISPMVRQILEAIPRGSRGPYVFSTSGGAKAMTIGSKIKDKLDAILKWPEKLNEDGEDESGWTWHDLRRTVRTNLSKLRVPEEVREALMGHIKTGLIRVQDIYDLADEKRDALMLWEARLMTIVDPPPPNVENIEQARARRVG